ncbi:phosphohexomutase domain-containing protein [Desulforhopalus singaporensis]|uniref:Phosphomannomutase n=1 Tax=Desulforhopalus singaporensis TaxID=91360 RepID=A0A1H0PD74_9BACT|nr:phosphoglucomutase [Desulforhopalus singaporensis]SDP02961.1 phosphomannomutase [Desulforhopalus singaporensis]
MAERNQLRDLFDRFVVNGDHRKSDYLGLIRELIKKGYGGQDLRQQGIDKAYQMLYSEIIENSGTPEKPVSFGTSGWRGVLGKEIFVKSVTQVTRAIVSMYRGLEGGSELCRILEVKDLKDAQKRGCVLGFDNRFGGEILAIQAAKVLVQAGFKVHYAGESTTGVLSASLIRRNCAFSINLTPSHNPMEYGGYKFNGGDGGPAPGEVTSIITENAQAIVEREALDAPPELWSLSDLEVHPSVEFFDSLQCWMELVKQGEPEHGLNLQKTLAEVSKAGRMAIAVDCIHGASRVHMDRFFQGCDKSRLVLLRNTRDTTFGGVSPEPSGENLKGVAATLEQRKEPLKLGAIIDPDGDRIRFYDGHSEIDMNRFGAIAYHFLHEKKGKRGMAGKTVATSNLVNSIAMGFGESVFEPPVGFKYFKPVIGKALVIFEESDGISIIGHTPEKDAYIGLLLAIEIMVSTGMSLGEYLGKIEARFGGYYPHRDGVKVEIQGRQLEQTLSKLDQYRPGKKVRVGEQSLAIAEVIDVDGYKMILADGSWLMIRPSGTEPKVRFYVESRSADGAAELVETAKNMLREIGILK